MVGKAPHADCQPQDGAVRQLFGRIEHPAFQGRGIAGVFPVAAFFRRGDFGPGKMVFHFFRVRGAVPQNLAGGGDEGHAQAVRPAFGEFLCQGPVIPVDAGNRKRPEDAFDFLPLVVKILPLQQPGAERAENQQRREHRKQRPQHERAFQMAFPLSGRPIWR